MQTALNLYAYDCFRRFLRDFYAEQKQCAPKIFSHRFFSRRAGFASSNALLMVMKGQRNLSAESARRLTRMLPFSERERQYFGLLVHYTQARDQWVKQELFEKMLAFREYCEARQLTAGQYAIFARWYYAAIRELVNVAGFREDPHWIGRTLRPAVPARDVQEALRVLCAAGLLVRDAKGRLRQAHRLLRTPPVVRSRALFAFHHDMIGHGQQALALASTEREVSALTMSVTRAQSEQIRQKLQGLHQEIQALVGNVPETVDAALVMQLNFQWFPLVRTTELPCGKEAVSCDKG